MTEAAFNELYKSVQLRRFFWAEARRHFGKDEELQKDAVSEAWARIVAQPDGEDFDEYRKHGGRAIRAMYQRRRYRARCAWTIRGRPGLWPSRAAALKAHPEDREKLERVPLSDVRLDAGPDGKPSSALHALAQKAIAGDW